MKRLVALVFAFAVLVPSMHGAEFFVAPNGDDSNPGTDEKPFATLQRAQEAVRKAERKGNTFVNVHGGVYSLTETLVFTAEDSGAPRAEVHWKEVKGETVVVEGIPNAQGVLPNCLLEFRGTEDRPAKFITFKDFTFRHTAGTLAENKESLLPGSAAIFRGGAVFFNGTEDCDIENSIIEDVGGNAIFVSNYNRRMSVGGCRISRAGAGGIVFAGDPQAVRLQATQEKAPTLGDINKAAGQKTNNYPSDCSVEDCIIFETGRVEKQTAAIEIDTAMSIAVRRCSIYDVPGAGIRIGDGCWGGHIIELCDVFDTGKETAGVGAFHSRGRDRFQGVGGIDWDTLTLGENKELPRLDALRPNILRDNRWRCAHGPDIDLGDDSTHYEIRHNLCLNGGMRIRGGFYRVIENNIIVNNTFQPQAWHMNSHDVFRGNIVFAPYNPADMRKPWGRICDGNFLHQPGATESKPATQLQEQSGRDEHSIVADAMFTDAAKGDYTVKEGSPAVKLGFENFPMNLFGVRRPDFKAIARTPILPGSEPATDAGKK